MKPIRWEETEHHYIAIARPDELFDLSTLTQLHPDDREVDIEGKHILTGKKHIYAFAYNKNFGKQFVIGMVERIPELFLEKDKRDMALLKSNTRKTA